MDEISSFLGIAITAGSAFGVVVVGVLYLLGIIKGKKDGEDDRLIGLLKETVDALETKVNKQKQDHDHTATELTKKIDNLTVEVGKLKEENHTLRDVLQGRDEATRKFYAESLKAMSLAGETHTIVKELLDTRTETNENIKALIDLISKQMGLTSTTSERIIEAAKLPTQTK